MCSTPLVCNAFLFNAIFPFAEAQPNNKLTLNVEKLRQDKLLTRYVENKEALELQCLYAVQALVTQLEHPQGKYCWVMWQICVVTLCT